MKKIIFFGVVFMFGLWVDIVFAITPAFLPFGGRITVAPITPANCPDAGFEVTSPFVIVPSLPSVTNIPGPFSAVPGPQTFGQVVVGAWILGNYLPFPIPDCFVGIPPAATLLPVYKATIYTTSVPVDLPI